MGNELNLEIFELIVDFFRTYQNETTQIELLPFYPVPETHIYVESTSIGIPKSSLYKAFYHAHKVFFTTLPLHKSSPTKETSKTLVDASTVLLLHDSEYLTAVNARKRILLSLYPTGTAAPSPSRTPPGTPQPIITPQSEFLFLTSILTSPLHRHTKSPILFSHRRWLISTYPYLKYPGLNPFAIISPRTSIDNSVTTKAFKKWCRKEVGILFRAAEGHPKNYYAWTYARWLVKEVGVVFNQEDMVSWCLKHPGDISGWEFLAWSWIGEAEAFRIAEEEGMEIVDGKKRDDVLQQRYNQLLLVMKYSHNTAPGHESLWGFVKAVITEGVFDEDEEGMKKTVVDTIRQWDAREWPVRSAEDVRKERALIQNLLKELDGRGRAALMAEQDSEMIDRPP
ncbi:hypothetical protein ABW19_dt0204806 [Dactylella cylindrospora]|nr:hypothetical protein ABW19_dt0204806 [Dactylella cylindrospora]